MKIFLSHSARTKPLVRELRGYLPPHVNSWIDESELISGDSLDESIQNVIQLETDFVVLFVDEAACRSDWVKKEVAWAREQEERLGRPFILPILVEDFALGDFAWIKDRVHRVCQGFREADVMRLASELSSDLFAWLSRDLERLRRPTSERGISVLDEADRLLQRAAHEVRAIVFPYRKNNPLRIASLYDKIVQARQLQVDSLDDLHELLFRLRQRRLLSGIVVASGTIYVEEEHLNWRSQEATAAKQAVADAVVDWISDGQVVFLDAGSTTIRICRNICRGVRFGQWERLTVVTNSVPVAGELASVANELGLEDYSPRLQVFVGGGRMRMNTSCVVGTTQNPVHIETLAGEVGGFDIAFVGTNGVWWPDGCTTTSPLEAKGKNIALSHARRRVILAESSKYDVRQQEVFAGFDMDLEIATAVDEHRNTVDQFASRLAMKKSRIILIDP